MSKALLADDENSVAPLATFDFAIAETLSAIGHPPRFLAGLKGYETYTRQGGVIPTTTNLGYRFLPNYELLASHPPQHILISPPAHASLLPRLRKITDVMEYPLYNYADGDGNHSDWETIEALTRQLGTLVNDAAASEQYIEQTNRYFDDLKSQLSSIDEPVLMVRLVDERHARVYGKGSVEGMVLNRLGLQNAWQGDLGQWGMTTVSATSLFSINAKMIFLESPYDPSGGQRQLLADGQWRHLPTVKEGNYLIIPTNYWSWGGLPAARHFAESLANHLIESAAPPAR
ncbi:ABC transporter substrate-binding protein [Halomonas sp. AOP13-D3-9]